MSHKPSDEYDRHHDRAEEHHSKACQAAVLQEYATLRHHILEAEERLRYLAEKQSAPGDVAAYKRAADCMKKAVQAAGDNVGSSQSWERAREHLQQAYDIVFYA